MLRMLTIAALCVGAQAGAQVQTGNQLYDACASGEDVQLGFCIGYISGTWEGMKLGALQMASIAASDMSTEEMDGLINEFLQVCMPALATGRQAIDISLEYIESNPSTRHESARSLIHSALREAFPCS